MEDSIGFDTLVADLQAAHRRRFRQFLSQPLAIEDQRKLLRGLLGSKASACDMGEDKTLDRLLRHRRALRQARRERSWRYSPSRHLSVCLAIRLCRNCRANGH